MAGDPALDKLTYEADFRRVEATLLSPRTGFGFDVHALAAGEELWLGGVLVPHDKGLEGHSDADVVLHALTDALLGTIAAATSACISRPRTRAGEARPPRSSSSMPAI